MSVFDKDGWSHKRGFYTFFTYCIDGKQYDGSHHSIKPNLSIKTITKRLRKNWGSKVTISDVKVTHSTPSRFRVNRSEL